MAKPPKRTYFQRSEDYAKQVSSEIIEQIKKGTAPWQKPWKPGEQHSPSNLATGKAYTGGNSLYLMSRQISEGRGDNRWGTYRQIEAAGGQVRRGEQGTKVLFYQNRTEQPAKDETGKIRKDKEGKTIYEETERSQAVMRQYTVFNVEQTDGLKLPSREAEATPEWDTHREADKVLRASGAKVQHVPGGDRAYYRMAEDKIVLPDPSQFATRNGYYQTALHEAGHSTGHHERMNRDTLKEGMAAGFGSPEYAREELRAEISAMMTGEQVGVGHDPQRGAAYVENWVAVLFYLLERLRLALENPDETARVKLMVVDEAWRYLQDPAVLSYLAEAAKTWRKKNAALIVATQSAVDVTGTAGAEALLESMPTKLFLANPDLPEKAAETFRLNPSEMNIIRGLIPKRELYLRRTDAAGILRLEVDPASYWLYTSSPVDAAKRAAAVEEHGLEQALEHLSKRR